MRQLALVAFIAAAQAWANPMMSSQFQAVQVPGTRHVQLTWLNVSEKVPVVAMYVRDDKAWELKWKPTSGFKANLGSGYGSHPVVQACDCNLALGQHSFRVFPGDKEAGRWSMGGLTARFEVLARVPDPAKEPEKPAEPAPQGIFRFGGGGEPAPRGIQGLDCRAECSSGATAPESKTQPQDTAVRKEASLGNGWYILDGRFIRPPYKLVLDNYRLELNGEVIQKFERFTEASQMKEQFGFVASAFKYNPMTIRCDQQDSSQSHVSEAQAKAWLKRLDEITRSKVDRSAKIDQVSREGRGIFSGCAEKIVDRWNGGL